MAKRKGTENETVESAKSAKRLGTSPKGKIVKKTKVAVNPKVKKTVEPKEKAKASKSANSKTEKTVKPKTVNSKSAKSNTEVLEDSKGRTMKPVVERLTAAKQKTAASKTVAKETSPKAVKRPKPKTSPRVGKKAAAVPKIATPEKKLKKTVKKASPTVTGSPTKTNTAAKEKRKKAEKQPSAEPEPRKRARVVKEEVAAKKAKVEITVGFRHQRGSGVALTIGQGDVGQLGLGEDVLEKNRPAQVPNIEDVIDVYAGGMHTVCLTSKGEVYTFGCNDEGALGRDTSREGSEFEAGLVSLPGQAVQVSAGDSHTAALLDDGRVFIWGNFRDSHGTMGLNSFGSQKLPIQILSDVPIIKIASGADHFVCLSHDGHVYTCGCAEQGQLGRVAEVFSNRGGRKGKQYLLNPQLVALGKGKKKVFIDDIWTGSYCTFVRAKDTGIIYVFGLNNYNQLGLPTQGTRFQPEISDGFKGHKWISISCGQHHTLALDEEGKVYSLGRKEYGRLGLGENASDVAVPTLIPVLENEKCVEVAAGEAVSFAVTEKGTAYSWGMGTNGQLGQGNEDDVVEPLQIKGKQLENRLVLAASAGGQHTVLLAKEKSIENSQPTDEQK